ncbi:MAG: ArgE/DapE family deacylase, partial [Candidatus Latescibacterota bacterium]
MDRQKLRKHVAARLDAMGETAAEILMDLIRFPSVCGEEMGAVNYMKDLMESSGFSPRIIPINPAIKNHPEYTFYTKEPSWEGRGSLVTDYGGAGKGRSLTLNAHLDVVPAGVWAEGYDPRREGDSIIGRGACDDKGGVVASYLALRALSECGIVTSGRLSCHHVIDEETGGNGTLSLLADGYTSDAAIVGECTNNVICPSNRGAVWFQLTTTGISTHMGEIENGISAIEKAVQAIDILKEYERYLIDNFMDHPYFRGLKHRPIQLCIGMIRSGVWPSMVPDKCEVEGGMGFLPNKDLREVESEMRQWILDRGDEWLRTHFEIRFDKLHNAAYEVPPDHPFAAAMQDAAKYAGLSDSLQGWPVSCDARLFGRVAGMPVICAGPGQLKHAHSATEQVCLS